MEHITQNRLLDEKFHKNPATSNEKVSRKFLSHVVCTNPSITTLDNFVQMGRFQDDGSGLPHRKTPKNHEGPASRISSTPVQIYSPIKAFKAFL